MTRLPTESRAVKGVDGPAYELNRVCAKPGCTQSSSDPHHCWRRSELIGPYWYVHIEDDDAIVGNVVGLCQNHHNAITVNAAWIKWENGQYTWSDMLRPTEPLSFQPPVRHAQGGPAVTPTVEPEPEIHEWNEDDLKTPSQVIAEGSCPTCLRPLPHPKEKSETKRERRTWSITVPKDEREDGAETLDTLLEEARVEMARAGLPYGDAEAARFFVLTQALGLFVTHADSVLT